MFNDSVGLGCSIVGLLLIVAMIPAWITHVVYSITNELWVVLVVGAVVPPVGVIHGFMIWFGGGM